MYSVFDNQMMMKSNLFKLCFYLFYVKYKLYLVPLILKYIALFIYFQNLHSILTKVVRMSINLIFIQALSYFK